MAGVSKREQGNDGQWPIAVALMLCALFVAAIILKAKNDIDSQNARIFDDAYNSAKIISSNIDADYVAIKSAMVAIAKTSAASSAQYAASNSLVEIVANFDAAGAVVSSTAENGVDIAPLSAASQMATDIGWMGAVARNDGRFSPVIAVRDLNNETAVASLKLNPNSGLMSGQSVVITDTSGAILFASPLLKLQGVKNVKQALNISKLPENNVFWGQKVTSINGDKLVLGGHQSKSGFQVFVAEAGNNSANGLLKTILFYSLLFMGPVLAFLGIVFMVKDQAGRANAAQFQVREAERRLRIAIEGARCGVWDWNLTDDNVYLTARLAKTFGFKDAGRYDTDQLLEALREDDKLRLRAALRSSVQIGIIDITLQIINKDGALNEKPVYIQFRGRAAAQKENPSNLRIIGVSIDVSDQMQIENRVAAAERRLRDAINSFSGPFALWSREGTIISWNDAFHKTFNLDASVLTNGAKYENISKASANAVVSRRADRTDPQAQEIQLQNGNWLRMIERRTTDGGLVSIGIDISPQKQSEDAASQNAKQLSEVVEALRASEHEAAELAKRYEQEKIRAEHASKSKDVFLANMSHELRTPLNAIIGFSDMMMREMYGALGNPNYREYIRDINQSGVHLLELINGVLDMAKIESGKFKIYPKNMSIEETVEQAVRIIRGKADEKGIVIEQDLAKEDFINADARAIRQILINLLSNAVKFTDNKGRVLIRTRIKDENMVISVIDNGIGIEETDISRLARPFEQVENEHSRVNQGTGLGLALCNSFAQMHGGHMNITSRIGVGTKVDVTIPLNCVQHEEAA